jgi:hypothetical protein
LVVIKGAKPNNGVYTGILRACGRLGEVGRGPLALGAACGISKGYHGKGRITYTGGGANPGDKNGHIYSLHDITWKTSTGGVFPFYASGQDGLIAKNKHGRDLVIGILVVMADPNAGQRGFPGCQKKSTKGDAKTPGQDVGGRRFAVRGTFNIWNNAWIDPQQGNEAPGLCKKDNNPMCLYKSKKPQTPKA